MNSYDDIIPFHSSRIFEGNVMGLIICLKLSKMPCQLFAYCVVSGNTNVEKSFQEIYNDDSMFIVIINVYIPNRRLDSLRNTLRLARYCSSMMLLCISKKFKENNSVTTCISSAYNIMLILEQGYYHFFFQYRFIHFYS